MNAHSPLRDAHASLGHRPKERPRLRSFRSWRSRIVFVLGAIAAMHGPARAVELVDVELGFRGVARVGFWTPIRATLAGELTSEIREIRVLAPDSDGNDCCFASAPLRVMRGDKGQTLVDTLARIGRMNPRLRVEIAFADGTEVSRTWPARSFPDLVLPTQFLVLEWGDELPWRDVMRWRASERRVASRAAAVPTAGDLPTHSLAYDGVDVVCISLRLRESIEAVSEDQWQALEIWLLNGGRLVVSAGPDAEDLVRATPPLQRLLASFPIQGRRGQRQVRGLEAFIEAEQRLDLVEPNKDWQGIELLNLRPGDGVSLAWDGVGASRVDWIVQAPFGMGSILAVPLDWLDSPIRLWHDRPKLVARLLDAVAPSEIPDATAGSPIETRHLGYDDLSGQLRMALDQFPDVQTVSFVWIALAAAGYITVIGVGDYLLHWSHGRGFWWTWLTLPLVVLAVSAGSVGTTLRSKGSQDSLNRLEIVDVDMRQGILRGTAWYRYYSPTAARMAFAGLPRPIVGSDTPELSVSSWQAFAGRGIGGMSSDVRLESTFQAARQDGPLLPENTRIRYAEVGCAPHSSLGLTVRWHGRTEALSAGTLTSDRLGQLDGSVVNPLSCRLLETGLVFDRWYYELGRLEPGEERPIDRSTTLKDLVSYLSRRRIVDAREVTIPWEKTSTDLTRIGEVLMFHRKAGGLGYTGLLHRVASTMDLSDHLRLKTAILCGRVVPPVMDLTRDGSPLDAAGKSPVSYVRVLLPVASDWEPVVD